MKLIDKDKIAAEIEKLIDKGNHYDPYQCAFRDGNNAVLYALKGHINTLETKEIDWDALAILAEHLIACEAHGVTPKYSDREIDMLEKLRKQ